nr:hypothetical protein [Pandoravirus massiliensis]
MMMHAIQKKIKKRVRHMRRNGVMVIHCWVITRPRFFARMLFLSMESIEAPFYTPLARDLVPFPFSLTFSLMAAVGIIVAFGDKKRERERPKSARAASSSKGEKMWHSRHETPRPHCLFFLFTSPLRNFTAIGPYFVVLFPKRKKKNRPRRLPFFSPSAVVALSSFSLLARG